MSKHSLFIVLMPVMLLAISASATELTLERAMSLAESHSYQLKADHARSRAFEQSLKAAAASRMPTLSAAGVASYKNTTPEFEIQFPTGDVLRREIGSKEMYQVDLRLNLPLYTGGRIGGSIDMAESTLELYEATRQISLDQVLLLARTQYLALYRSDQLVAAARAALKRAEVISRDTQSLYEAGAADSVNILDAQMAVVEADLRLKSALSVRRQDELKLAILLGIDPAESIALDISPAEPGDLPIESSEVSESKPELTASTAAIGISRATVKVTRSELLPAVSLAGGYSWGKPNIDQFNDEFNDYFTVGAHLTWSFNLGGQSVRNVSKSKHLLSAAQHEYDRTLQQLDEKAKVIAESLKMVLERYRSAKENYRIVSANYRLATEKHRQGVLSANRLIEIETALSEAEASLASTRADFYIVQSQYYHAIGSNLLKEGI